MFLSEGFFMASDAQHPRLRFIPGPSSAAPCSGRHLGTFRSRATCPHLNGTQRTSICSPAWLTTYKRSDVWVFICAMWCSIGVMSRISTTILS
jgi:hypothetical protein